MSDNDNNQKKPQPVVNGKSVTKEQLAAMQADPKVKLNETSPGQFKKTDRMYG